jgi:hypothetical protein
MKPSAKVAMVATTMMTGNLFFSADNPVLVTGTSESVFS